ncbi:ankyrin repeat domain-containing protein [Tessaracoccus lubricantis]|uniref:Ankyrin repeat domain-containing protein n=1 Tax=Tessaracoccus lubricantis TaxID=545543 RepID=A0ABP9FCE8_9ACTN
MTQTQWPELVATATADEVREHLAAGADPSAVATTEQQRSSAVLIAARAGNHAALDVLIEAGADIDAQNRISLNPFLWACISNDLAVARRMVEAGTDLELVTRFGGVGIHPSAEKGHVELTRYLAEETDVNVNHTNICGWTPLLEAIILRDGGPEQQEIVRILLAAGADPKMVDQWGVTPLQHAEKMGFTEIADLLKAAGA